MPSQPPVLPEARKSVADFHAGTVFLDGQALWETVGFVDQPQLILENILTGQKMHLVVNCPNAECFERVDPIEAAYYRGLNEGRRRAREGK